MAINNKPLGQSANQVTASPGEQVLPKLIDHNTTEEHFQEGMDDVARQVDQTQIDIGYAADISTARTGAQLRSVDARLDTLEAGAGVGADGMIDSSMSTLPVGQATIANSDISGTLSSMRINANAVNTPEIMDMAVTSAKIEDGTIVNADVNAMAGIQRTKLETDIQTHNVVVGDNTAVSTNLGNDIDVPLFNRTGTVDGVVNAPETTEDTTAAVSGNQATGDLWVLNSDNDWVQLNNWVLNTARVPASAVETTISAHTQRAAITAPGGFDAVVTYLLTGANRVEGTPPATYALENGDLINFTDTTPSPEQTYAIVYIGPSVAAGTDIAVADRGRFVQLGAAQTYEAAPNGGLSRAGTQFSLAEPIPGTRTFSGPVTTNGALTGMSATFSGTLTANGNVVLGDASTDDVTITGSVNSNIIPEGTSGSRALGSSTARWDLFADAIDATSIAGPITDSNIAEDTLSVNRLNPAGMAAQVPTINSAGDQVEWMDPPIGVEMVTMLPDLMMASVRMTYPTGVLVSLTQADGDAVAGIYRADGMNWVRLGTVNAILSKQDLVSVSGQTNYTTTLISAAHFITIDGLVLVEGSGATDDYTVDSDRLGFTLREAVPAGRDIVVHNFSDVAMLGAGEVPLSALATGTFGTGINIPGDQVDTSMNRPVSSASVAARTTTADVTGTQTDGARNVVFTSGSGLGNSTALQGDSGANFQYNPSTNVLSVPSIQIGQFRLAALGDGTRLDIIVGSQIVASIGNDGHIRARNNITAFTTTP